VTAESMSTTDLLRELEQVVETNLNRHLSAAKEWFPHEYVPWSQGTDFDGVLGGQAWTAEQSRLSDVARTSLVVNLLTEDNLPSYTTRSLRSSVATVRGAHGFIGGPPKRAGTASPSAIICSRPARSTPWVWSGRG